MENICLYLLFELDPYIIKINDKFNKILDEDRIYFLEQRIRDIEYDKENNVFFLLFEHTPSIGVLKLNN